MRLVSQHNHVGPVTQQFRSLELVNQGEDTPVILAEQLPQLLATLRMAHLTLCLTDCATGLERLGDLVV